VIRQSAIRFLWLPTINSTDECVFSALSAVPFGALTAPDRGEHRQAAGGVAEVLSAIRVHPAGASTARRPPWTAEVAPNCFIIRDADGQALSYVYYESEPGRRSAAKLLSKDEPAGRGQHRQAAGPVSLCDSSSAFFLSFF